MEDLIELLFEVIIAGSAELLPNRKVPKWIRIIISLVYKYYNWNNGSWNSTS